MLFCGQECIVKTAPDYVYEVAVALSVTEEDYKNEYYERMERIEALREPLTRITEYRHAILREASPILQAQPELLKYFEIFNDLGNGVFEDSFAIMLAANIGENELTHEEIDRLYLMTVYNSESNGDEREHASPDISFAEMTEIVLSGDLSDRLKLLILSVYAERYEVIPRIAAVLFESAKICEKYFDIVRGDFEGELSTLENLGDFKLSAIEMTDFEKPPEVTLSIFLYNNIRVWASSDLCGGTNMSVRIGIHIRVARDFMSLPESEIRAQASALKALSDPMRWKVLWLLRGKTLGQKEIADAVELTPPTVSHHLSTLLNEELIRAEIPAGKRRITYTLNSEKVRKLAETLQKLATYN